MPTRTLTINVKDITETNIEGVSVSAILIDDDEMPALDFLTSGQGTILSEPIRTTTNENGIATLDLIPTASFKRASKYRITFQSNEFYKYIDITMPNNNTTLRTLIPTISSEPETPVEPSTPVEPTSNVTRYFAVKATNDFAIADYQAGLDFTGNRWTIPTFVGNRYFGLLIEQAFFFTDILLDTIPPQDATSLFTAATPITINGVDYYQWISNDVFFPVLSGFELYLGGF